MILDSQTKVIRAYLGGATATLPVQWNVSYADHDLVSHNFVPGHAFGTMNSSTPVTLIDSPAFNNQRQAKLIAVFNTDSAGVTLTVDVYDGTNARIWYSAFLDVGWSAQWEPGGTWHVYDQNGILQMGGITGGGGGTFTAGISGGNTSGDTGTVTNRIVFAGGNNITLSGSTNGAGMTVTISGGAGGGGGPLTFFATNNTTQSTSGTINSNSIIVRGEGAVSAGISNGSIVISSPLQTNQTEGVYALGNTTGQSSSSTHDARTLSINGAGIVSVGWSNSSFYISATVPAQTNQTVGLYGVGNTTQNSSTTLDARTISFGGRGDITVGFSNGTVQISGNQTNQQITMFATGNTTQSSTNTTNASSIIFAGSGAASVGLSGGTILISVPNVVAQTVQTLGIYGSSQTTGQSSSSTYDARSLTVVGQGIISVGWSNSSFLISATQSNQAFSAGAASSAFQTLSFQDSNGISFSNNAGAIRLTHDLQFTSNTSAITSNALHSTKSNLSIFATSNTTLSSSGTLGSNSFIFAGAGIASVGFSNGSVVVSVPSGGGAGDGGNIIMVSTGGHTAGNTGSTSTGTIVLEGTSSLTLSQITGGAGVHTIRIVPAMSQLTAGNNISLSTAGSTISIINIGAGTGVTTGTTQGSVQAATLSTNGLSILEPVIILSDFEPEVRGQTTSNTIAMGTGYIQNFVMYDNISMYRMQLMHQITTQATSSQSYTGSVSGGAGSTGATGRVGTTGTFWFMSRESTGTAANSSNIVSFYSNSISQQLDMFATWSNSTNASSATLRLTTSCVLTFVSSVGSNSWTTGTVTSSGSTSFSSTSTAAQTFSSSFGHSFASLMLSGVRPIMVPMFTSLSPGKYWMAQNWSTSSGSTGLSLQRPLNITFGIVAFTTNTQGFLRIGATQTTANSNLTQGWGSHSATSKFSTTFAISEVSNMSQYQTWFNLQALVS